MVKRWEHFRKIFDGSQGQRNSFIDRVNVIAFDRHPHGEFLEVFFVFFYLKTGVTCWDPDGPWCYPASKSVVCKGEAWDIIWHVVVVGVVVGGLDSSLPLPFVPPRSCGPGGCSCPLLSKKSRHSQECQGCVGWESRRGVRCGMFLLHTSFLLLVNRSIYVSYNGKNLVVPLLVYIYMCACGCGFLYGV